MHRKRFGLATVLPAAAPAIAMTAAAALVLSGCGRNVQEEPVEVQDPVVEIHEGEPFDPPAYGPGPHPAPDPAGQARDAHPLADRPNAPSDFAPPPRPGAEAGDGRDTIESLGRTYGRALPEESRSRSVFDAVGRALGRGLSGDAAEPQEEAPEPSGM